MEYLSQICWKNYFTNLAQSQTSQSKLNQNGNDIVHIEDRGWEIENRRCELGDWGRDSWDAGMGDVSWVITSFVEICEGNLRQGKH